MDIRPIIVREYLESLSEKEQLDYIFPILLESQGFIILSNPKVNRGFSEYGKDIVAVGFDFEDGVEKRFYFELKGGEDRHVTDKTYSKKDGIRESLCEAKDRRFEFSNKRHEALPLKIVLVHNGEIKLNVKDTFDHFIDREFPPDGNIEFDRWDISTLTKLFSQKLFSAFLLTDSETTKLFNKVLINLDASETVTEDFEQLLDKIFSRINDKTPPAKLPRKWMVLFETLHLISFILYTEAKTYNNLSIAKKYISFLILRFWYWILKNKFEMNKKITKYFERVLIFYFDVLTEYFKRTLPIAQIKDGLYSEDGGRYEQIGYTCRTLDYLQDLCFYLSFINHSSREESAMIKIKQIILNVINANDVSGRPLLDIHSIPIINILLFFIINNDELNAKLYLTRVLDNIKNAKEKYDRLPDANNDLKNVIKYITTYEKPLSYSDSTSTLLAILMEFIVILDIEEFYYLIRDFIIKNKIDIAIFVPHHGVNSTSKHLIEDNDDDLEEQLFSKSFFCEGYQHNIILKKHLNKDLNYSDYKNLVYSLKEEFTYNYRTDSANYSFLKDLAHIYFKTPYFPDKWRIHLKNQPPNTPPYKTKSP